MLRMVSEFMRYQQITSGSSGVSKCPLTSRQLEDLLHKPANLGHHILSQGGVIFTSMGTFFTPVKPVGEVLQLAQGQTC